VVSGSVKSSILRFKQAGHTEVRDLSATYNLRDGKIDIQDIRARVLGGALSARLSIYDFARSSHAKLLAHIRDISLESLEVATQHYPPATHLSRSISVETVAPWNKRLARLEAHGDATLEGVLGQNPSAPMNGAIHVGYSALRNELELRQSYFRTSGTTLLLNGKVGRHSHLHVAANSSNLHEVELLAANVE